jgi:hypothetical protein
MAMRHLDGSAPGDKPAKQKKGPMPRVPFRKAPMHEPDFNPYTSCHCGQPLHYSDKEVQHAMEAMVRDKGPYVPVTVQGRTWRVQRHYIALHVPASTSPISRRRWPKVGMM